MSTANQSWPLVFKGRHFGVLGLGNNGLPAALTLAAMGASVAGWDDRLDKRESAAQAGVSICVPSAMGQLDALVLSPGIPHNLPRPHPEAVAAIAHRIPILSDAELLYRAVRTAGSAARFVGVTGTNGKSTTTALTAHILRRAGLAVAAGGNLGPSALSLPLLGDHGVYVLEMSSYMLERIVTMRFDAAAMLNITPDHLDRHGNIGSYVQAKEAIFARQGLDDRAVIEVDDAESRAMAERLDHGPARVIRISGENVQGVSADIWTEGTIVRDFSGGILNLHGASALPGTHNAQNAAAAAALAQAIGVPNVVIAKATRHFAGLPHRQARIAEIDGIVFINDSKATNADAAARALSCHHGIIWIAGGIAKAGGISALAPYFPRIAHALLIGAAANEFAVTLSRHHVPHTVVETLERAVCEGLAKARAEGSKVILLSPACASFDQFADFAARGDAFAHYAQALVATSGVC